MNRRTRDPRSKLERSENPRNEIHEVEISFKRITYLRLANIQ